MNQRIENELNSILEELENLGHCKNDLISHCLKQDGIQIARRWDIRRVVILGMLIVGMSYLFFLMKRIHIIRIFMWFVIQNTIHIHGLF